MPGKLVTALTALIVVALPLILVGNAVWLLLNSLFVEAQYALPGFPVDPDGVQDPARTELAKTGVASIRPGSEGVALLEAARLPNGEPAFDAREVRHMADVRSLVTGLTIAWAVALAGAVAAGVALRRLAEPDALRRALFRGALVTVVGMVLLGLLMAVSFETFFEGFHELLFEPGTWRFSDADTLRQLYPDAFWSIAGATVAVLVLAQAAAIAIPLRGGSRKNGAG